jgi:predicted SprT family Zn-dependent metalloprotease
MNLVKKVRSVLPGRDRPKSQSAKQGSTHLYRCECCEITYMCGEMDTCSRCDGPVESIPTEQDLGLT